AVAIGLAPDRLGLWLDTGDGVEDGDRAVEHTQAPLDLDRKVHVPGRIDNVHAKVAPERRRRSRRDRDPALLLLGHPVHYSGAFVDLAHLVGATGEVEDPLGRRRLARVDMGHDPDVPDAVQSDRGAFRLIDRRHRLPPVVRKRLVDLRHPVEVVLALERVALLVEGVQDLAGELLRHVLLAPVARVGDEPAHRERARAALRHLDGHLVVGAADAAGAHFEHRRDRLDRLLEHFDRRLAGLLADARERAVDDLLGRALLPARHHAVDHLADQARVVDWVRMELADRNLCSAGHYEPFLAPYLERRLRRSPTTTVTSRPRLTL